MSPDRVGRKYDDEKASQTRTGYRLTTKKTQSCDRSHLLLAEDFAMTNYKIRQDACLFVEICATRGPHQEESNFPFFLHLLDHCPDVTSVFIVHVNFEDF